MDLAQLVNNYFFFILKNGGIYNMTLFQIFFLFCKQEKIMDIIFDVYHTNNIGKYSWYGEVYFEPMTLEEFVYERINSKGMFNLLLDFELFQPSIEKNPRFKKASKNWNTFYRRNIKLSENFIKVGDEITINNGTPMIVLEIPKTFDNTVKVQSKIVNNNQHRANLTPFLEFDGMDYMYFDDSITIDNSKIIKINGVEKQPEYYIRKNRKSYGLNKK